MTYSLSEVIEAREAELGGYKSELSFMEGGAIAGFRGVGGEWEDISSLRIQEIKVDIAITTATVMRLKAEGHPFAI